ncbi:chorismate mutase [Streptodolium elevatio]
MPEPTPLAPEPSHIEPVHPRPEPQSLAEVRRHIDEIDAELVALLTRRQSLVRTAATFKTDEQSVRAPDRVERVIAGVRAKAEAAGLAPEVAEAVWRAMITAFITLELAEHDRINPAPPEHPA